MNQKYINSCYELLLSLVKDKSPISISLLSDANISDIDSWLAANNYRHNPTLDIVIPSESEDINEFEIVHT